MPDSEQWVAGEEFQGWVLPALKHCWFLTGPTASGKTPLAVDLAERLNAEIISMDSMAIYRGMDIGTAKPTREQRARVTHHQLDIIDPSESYSVSRYVAEVHGIASAIRARGRGVLICGGTPLYLKSLIRGLFLGPPADWEFRKSVEEDARAFGGQALRERLMQVDPLLAHKLHPNDQRRMIRALEVARATGKPLSHWQRQFEVPASPLHCPVAVLQLERSWLHERINHRVEAMIAAGLEQELRDLLHRYGELGHTAQQAVGYREMLNRIRPMGVQPGGAGQTAESQLEDGQAEDEQAEESTAWKPPSIEATAELIKAHTRQFARRQEIWFRGLQELQPVQVSSTASSNELADQIAVIFSALNAESTAD